MATKVHMEALSPTMEEGQVVKWLKGEGDAVSSGDVLAEIETDKATMELVARGDGVLRAILLDEGGVAPVGDVIGVIAEEGEDISDLVADAGSAGSAAPAAPKEEAPPPADAPEATPEPEPAAPQRAEPATASAPSATPTAPSKANGRIKATPVARRLASEAGVDLSTITGSGPGGRIIKKDVESRIADGPQQPAAEAPRAPGPAAAPAVADSASDYQDVPLSQMRKTIARRLVESIGPVPHFFLTIQVDMTRTVAARARINETLAERGEKVSLNDMIIRAAGAALVQHPAVNAHWKGDSVRRFRRAHIGVAVAVEDGLITPVIRDAHAKGIAQIAREVKEMAGRAREKKLKPEEYTGATFSISNLGMFGIHEFTAVINPPEAAILAVGGIEETPVVEDGALTTRPMMRVTMSCDHRTIDGATGSRFLQTLRAMLEDPVAILM